jgi:hypothetical protein
MDTDRRSLYQVNIRVRGRDGYEPVIFLFDGYVVAETDEYAYKRARNHMDERTKGKSAGLEPFEYSVKKLATVDSLPFDSELLL